MMLGMIVAHRSLPIREVVADADPSEPREENSDYFFACSGADFSMFKTLVEKDPSLVHKTTTSGEHCLHLCALEGATDIAQFLLDAGADPNIRSTWAQGLRMHPLSWSTFYGRHEIIELLLKHGADVNADFDLGKQDAGGAKKGTVLDVIEQILIGIKDEGEKDRFLKTRNVLVKYGAARYAPVEQEL
ncbi:hypothetical protein ACHAWU_003724 [Discostella pseudostelligera]|uniref:Uncharacterized protein n=1 Tax=Discostella pseudostelligera TaxID=259834 RepID=A0ABD3N648_9STRA